jgi:hypothetical protein
MIMHEFVQNQHITVSDEHRAGGQRFQLLALFLHASQ